MRSVQVYAPLVNNHHNKFFQVTIRKNEKSCCHQITEKIDPDLACIHHHGAYHAGYTAKTAYLKLMNQWRKNAFLPNFLLSPPRGWELEPTGMEKDCMISESNSSQLALLLGMLACQQSLPYAMIFATGEIDQQQDTIKVKPVAHLKEKVRYIFDYLWKLETAPSEPILIALPQYLDSEKKEKTAEKLKTLITTSQQQCSYLDITILYLDSLPEDLQKNAPSIKRYHHYNRLAKSIPYAFLAGLFSWQFSQPYYLNWHNDHLSPLQNYGNHPLRVSAKRKDDWQVIPLCPQSTLGNDVFSIGDTIMINLQVEDKSWLRHWTKPNVAVVLVGMESEIRVEDMKEDSDEGKYTIAYHLMPPEENYLIMAVAQRSFAIDKSQLNRKLVEISQGLHGFERFSVITGFLDYHFISKPIDYRYQIIGENCGNIYDLPTF